MADPKVYERYAREMEQSLIEKNTVTVSEFSKFAPLFNNTVVTANIQSSDVINSLMVEFENRFATHQPIRVIHDVTREVVFELPPLEISAPLLNDSFDKTGELLQLLFNVVTNKAQPSYKKDIVYDQLEKIYSQALESDGFKKIQKDTIAMTETLYKKNILRGEEDTTVPVENKSEWDWE